MPFQIYSFRRTNMALRIPFNDTTTTKTLAPFYSLLQVSAELVLLPSYTERLLKKNSMGPWKESPNSSQHVCYDLLLQEHINQKWTKITSLL